MKLKLLFLFLFLWSHIQLTAQITNGCGVDAIFKNSPELQKQLKNIEKAFNQKNITSANVLDLTTVYTIPLVFHVYHLGEAVGIGSNVSDAAIQATVDRLNAVYRATGIHAGKTPDIKIQFVLASFNPDCQATTGIVRVDGRVIPTYEANGVSVNDNPMHQSIRDLSSWDPNQYINVRICHNTNGYGWAYYLSDIFMGAAYTNTSPSNSSTDNFWAHEMGHSLNLNHTFEGDGGNAYCPANANPEVDGDQVSDTDPHKSGDGCNYTAINACTGNAFGDILKNIMSYSCWETFTPKQLERMRFALLNYRFMLTTSKGISGVSGVPLVGSLTKCAPGISNLRATDCNGVYNWYNTSTGGSSIATGQIYTTPNLTNSSTYYVSCTEAVCAPSSRAAYPITINPSSLNGNMCHVTAPIGPYFGYVLSNFNFGGINYTGTIFDNTESIQIDKTCTKTDLIIGNTYPFSFTNYLGFEMYGKIFIDYNNDGDFNDPNELAYSGGAIPTHTGNIVIPATVLNNIYLRMRVMLDMSNMTACNLPGDASGSGQAIDFSVRIICPLVNPPTVQSASRCGAGSVSLTANGCVTGNTYKWFTNSSSTQVLGSTAIFTSPVLSSSTSYYVSCNNGSCESSRVMATATISSSIASPALTSNISTILPGQSATITALNCTGSLVWNNGLSSSNIQTVSPTVSTSYSVTCNENTCTSTPAILRITVNVSNPCPNTITHTGTIAPDVFQAKQNISSNTNLQNQTKYLAGQSIQLNTGFSAGANEIFEAKIQGCPPLNGLMAHYKFNNNALDESGNNYNGTVNGAILTTDRFGLANKAYLFDGIDDYINLSNLSQSFGNQTPYSISIWVANISNKTGDYISRFSSTVNGEYAISNSSTGVNFTRESTLLALNSNTILPLNKWTHLTCTYDGTLSKIYINGVKVAEANSGNSISNTITNTLIGAKYIGTTPGDFVHAKIDEIRIYNLGLTALEVLDIYNSEK